MDEASSLSRDHDREGGLTMTEKMLGLKINPEHGVKG